GGSKVSARRYQRRVALALPSVLALLATLLAAEALQAKKVARVGYRRRRRMAGGRVRDGIGALVTTASACRCRRSRTRENSLRGRAGRLLTPITWSARSRSDDGIARPTALAVLRLMIHFIRPKEQRWRHRRSRSAGRHVAVMW